jgi:hypothetical protein
VDDRRPAFPHHKLCEPIGSDAAQVSEGFAITLRIMGLDANFPPAGIALATNTPNTEDN